MRPSIDASSIELKERPGHPCLVFLHIPKTAGQTISSSLIRNFPQDSQIHLNVLDKPLDEELERIPLETRAEARLLWGHMPFGVHRYLPQECKYFTVLREPVARVVSVYKYILRTPEHVLHDRVGGGVSLEDYLDSQIDESQTENSQTRQLSGGQFGPLDRDALEDAKRNLESFLIVGLTERFEETFVLLRRALGLRIPMYLTKNVSPRSHVSEREIDMIRERNELDLELYDFARELFAQSLARYMRFFNLEVSTYKALRPLSRVGGGRTPRLLRKLVREFRVGRSGGAE